MSGLVSAASGLPVRFHAPTYPVPFSATLEAAMEQFRNLQQRHNEAYEAVQAAQVALQEAGRSSVRSRAKALLGESVADEGVGEAQAAFKAAQEELAVTTEALSLAEQRIFTLIADNKDVYQAQIKTMTDGAKITASASLQAATDAITNLVELRGWHLYVEDVLHKPSIQPRPSRLVILDDRWVLTEVLPALADAVESVGGKPTEPEALVILHDRDGNVYSGVVGGRVKNIGTSSLNDSAPAPVSTLLS